jgi:FixJ family two-component response regulator
MQSSEICPKVQYRVTVRSAKIEFKDMPVSQSAIAIVEDDSSYRRALERLLRASGFEAHTFGSAEEFHKSATPESHACLILDIHLAPRLVGSAVYL